MIIRWVSQILKFNYRHSQEVSANGMDKHTHTHTHTQSLPKYQQNPISKHNGENIAENSTRLILVRNDFNKIAMDVIYMEESR